MTSTLDKLTKLIRISEDLTVIMNFLIKCDDIEILTALKESVELRIKTLQK